MSKQPSYSGTMPLTIGFLALALLVGGVGVWSVRTEISGAIIAPGMTKNPMGTSSKLSTKDMITI